MLLEEHKKVLQLEQRIERLEMLLNSQEDDDAGA
jgi:hypothetical protein